MERKVKVIQFGCGNMGRVLMRYAMESGAEMVAAFDMNPELIGRDISAVLGGDNRGTQIYSPDQFDAVLKKEKPDCVVVATRSFVRDVKDVLLTCARNGINAVTTCDESLYAWNSSPKIMDEIDKVARDNNCTITGSGFQDLSYCHLVAATAGAAHKITKIKGSAMYNVEDYGIALAEHHGTGYGPDKFEKEIASADKISIKERDKLIAQGEFKAIPMWNANGWLCAKLGLTVKTQVQTCTPLFAEAPLYSKTLGREIPVGEVIGMSAAALTETEEAITIETESIGKVYRDGEADTNDWIIYGEPDIYVSNKHIKNTEMICSEMISRIVDVINGPAGFVTTNNFGPARYLLKPMNEYLLSQD